MKHLFVAAALAAAAVPAAQAGAVPPGNTSLPLGSTNGCAVVATPAVPGTCNFKGSSSDIGYGGVSTGGFTLTHKQKVSKCVDGKTTADVELKTVTDDGASGSGPFYDGPSYALKNGVIYTFTVLGNGFGVIGGQGTPGPDMASDPAVGPAPGYAGAEDATKPVGTPC